MRCWSSAENLYTSGPVKRSSRCSPNSWTITWTNWRITTAIARTARRRCNIWRRRRSGRDRRISESGLAATALLGLQQFYLGRGELRKSHELDEELLALAHSTGNDGLLYEAMYLSGLTLYHTGDFVAARRNHEWVGKAESPREISAGLSEHPSVGCQAYLSVELWHLGYPDQAAAAVEEALRRAREESHPFSLAFAMMF